MWTAILASSLAMAQGPGDSPPEAPPLSGAPSRGDTALGARLSSWRGEETAPGIGGHLRLAPWDRMNLELFWDSFARPAWERDELWHSHIIGFHVMVPLVRAQTVVGPTFGACTSIEAITPIEREVPGVADLRFAPHAGLFVDHALTEHWTFGGRATAFAYVGNAPHLDGWSAQTSNALHVDPTVQLTAAVSRWF